MEEYFRVNNTRLAKYLYSLGFDKKSEIINKKETWLFTKSDDLQESLDFFFCMRKKIKNQNIQEMVKCQENKYQKKQYKT